MTILALDTSGTTASAALMNEYIILAESSVTLADLRGAGRKTHSETLMPMVDRLFEITGMALEDTDCIACTCGPGSFTGLRIGAATAKGLAFATGKPLIAVPTLDAMAYTVSSLAMPDTWVVPMMDARREQAYFAFYYEGKRMIDYMAEPVADLLDMLKAQVSKGSNIIFLGDGASAYRDRIAQETWLERNIVSFAPVYHSRLSAACVGACARTMDYAGESEFSLLYVRKPQAQREREAKLK